MFDVSERRERTEMCRVNITMNPNGDTRTADHIPSIEEFDTANKSHIKHVQKIAEEYAKRIPIEIMWHDITKVQDPYRSMFYRDMVKTMSGDMTFEDGEWAKIHYSYERHHLNRNCPEDVHWIDVLEMIIDCVAAGLARSGSIRPIQIDPEVLTRAVENTASYIAEYIRLLDKEGNDL